MVAAIRTALDERKIVPVIKTSTKEKTQSIAWSNRLLVFDRRPCFRKNNVDAILLNASGSLGEKAIIAEKARYLALGELKGGIDPQGADEHWKTAGSALDRLRESYGDGCPPIFFVGAAIERAMAAELFANLQDGTLAYAANLTVPEQLADLAAWLCEL